MNAPTASPPMDVPADYYRSIFEVEELHPWHRGMHRIAAALLGDRLLAPGASLLDAGCGTGGFLAWAATFGPARMCGVDISAEAIGLCAQRVPAAELQVAPLRRLPFEDGAFEVAVSNDVLQHVPESEMGESMRELRRVLRPGGALLVRTNGGRHAVSERDDWRLYDRRLLAQTLADAGFRCQRITHVNAVGSLLAALRGTGPRAPGQDRHGIPRLPGPLAARIFSLLLGAEAAYLQRAPSRLPSIPYGHTLMAVAIRP